MAGRSPTYRIGPVQVGDTIVHSGKAHVVESTDRTTGLGFPIADCADGWSIALNPDTGALDCPSPTPTWCVLPTADLMNTEA